MLQQTQVNRVQQEYYPNFLEKFPTLEILANAKEEEVISAWSGLGYYSRARNLHKTAQLTFESFPDNYKELVKLPGIGKYTASAICSFGYHQDITVIDTNIKRVLKRLFAIQDDNEKLLDTKAEYILNKKFPREHNLALMDLGSMVCTPKKPVCEKCPIHKECLGKEDLELYTKVKKQRSEKLDLFLGICIQDNKIALIKSNTTMYKNMLVLPNVEPIEDDLLSTFKHAYTKYNISVYLYQCEEIIEDKIVWVDINDLKNAPVASLTTKAIGSLKL